MNKMKQALNALLIAACFALAAVAARAASEPCILQQRWDFRQHQLTAYVRHTDGAAVSGVRIAGTEIENAAIAENPAETSLVTWILLDNSIGMPEAIRPKVSDFLLTLFREKAPGEIYNFCTFSDSISVKLRDSGSLDELQKRIKEVEYTGRRSNLTGALEKVFTEEADRESAEFVRVLVISAGGPIDAGRLRERLAARQSTVSSIPVYTIGCNNGSNADRLSEMYALSTDTRARSWDMDALGVADIVSIMRWEEIPVCISLTLPESLRGGIFQELIVDFNDGTSAHSMAFVTGGGGDTTEDVEAPEPEPEPVPEESGFPAGVIVLLVLLAGAGAAVFIVLRRRNEIVIPAAIAELFHVVGAKSGKAARIDDNGNLTLYLQDTGDPERRFHAPLLGPVTIGRGPDNAVVLSGDRSVSRAHCQIYLKDGELWIEDSNSSGGTFLENRRITNKAKLANGSAIRLGRTSYQVEVR